MGGLAIAITEDLCIVSIVQIKSQLGTGLFISFVICDLISFVLPWCSYTVCSDNGLIRRVELFGNSRDPLCPEATVQELSYNAGKAIGPLQ